MEREEFRVVTVKLKACFHACSRATYSVDQVLCACFSVCCYALGLNLFCLILFLSFFRSPKKRTRLLGLKKSNICRRWCLEMTTKLAFCTWPPTTRHFQDTSSKVKMTCNLEASAGFWQLGQTFPLICGDKKNLVSFHLTVGAPVVQRMVDAVASHITAVADSEDVLFASVIEGVFLSPLHAWNP